MIISLWLWFTSKDPKANLARSKLVKQKVRQAKNGKLSPEEIQHLKRRGININPHTKSLHTRLIRKITNWWETTPVEDFLEDVDDLLQNSAFLSIVALLAQITIITSLIGWWIGRPEARENEIFSTWQVVNDADEDQSGVVKIALERLLRKEFSLAGLKLENTNLLGANLQQAYLKWANLQQAVLKLANLQQAVLESANLQQADLFSANLQQVVLESANLQQASLFRANLQQASLKSANLQQAILVEVQNLTPEQIKSACFWETAIYKGEYDDVKEAFVVIEPDNTDFIENLKKDISSDPEEPIDCSDWEKKSN